MQNHALHNICILHRAYVFFSSETGMQSRAPDKNFRKTFGEKEDNSNRSEFQPSQNSTNWRPTVSPGEDEKFEIKVKFRYIFKTLVWYDFKTVVWYNFKTLVWQNLKPLCDTFLKPLCGMISKTLVWYDFKPLGGRISKSLCGKILKPLCGRSLNRCVVEV